MSFQKDRRLSVSTKVPKNFARTPPPAFLFPDQRFQRPTPEEPAKPFNARSRRRRCLPPLIFRVNQFFLKNFSNTSETRRPRRRRLSKEDRFLSQQGFSAFSQTRKPKLPNPLRQARRRPPRTARFRASGGYTDLPPSPQALNDSFTNYLNERESRSRPSQGAGELIRRSSAAHGRRMGLAIRVHPPRRRDDAVARICASALNMPPTDEPSTISHRGPAPAAAQPATRNSRCGGRSRCH